jgi:hypothetical protein
MHFAESVLATFYCSVLGRHVVQLSDDWAKSTFKLLDLTMRTFRIFPHHEFHVNAGVFGRCLQVDLAPGMERSFAMSPVRAAAETR